MNQHCSTVHMTSTTTAITLAMLESDVSFHQLVRSIGVQTVHINLVLDVI